MSRTKTIDINCDLGEGKSLSDCQKDALLMPFISSCNIACGGHAGSKKIMLETLKNAAKNQLSIGAHPGYPDRKNFGRLSVQISKNDLKETLKQQIEDLMFLAKKLSLQLNHIKFHGALYNDIESNPKLANLIARFCHSNYPGLKIMGLAGGQLESLCKAFAIDFIAEGFMDRVYLSNGRLTSRSQNNSMIDCKKKVVAQALSLAQNQSVSTSDGKQIKPKVQSICLHGDNINALSIAQLLNTSLKKRGFVLSNNLQQDHGAYQIFMNGDSAYTIVFTQSVSEQLSKKIMILAGLFKQKYEDIINEIIPGYQSLTFCYDPLKSTPEDIKTSILSILDRTLLNKKLTAVKSQSKLIKIPVCYDKSFAPDLAYVAKHCKLSEQELIRRHSNKEYLVHMLGFLPGFLYLGGLEKQLACPRRKIPRTTIEAGSVGIGGSQTGIYPIASPGGWQIIGRSPITLFNPEDKNLAIASPLDQVKFEPISVEEFYRIESLNSNKSGDDEIY